MLCDQGLRLKRLKGLLSPLWGTVEGCVSGEQHKAQGVASNLAVCLFACNITLLPGSSHLIVYLHTYFSYRLCSSLPGFPDCCWS